MKQFILLVSHSVVLGIGFVLGLYALPILTAPEAPSAEQVQNSSGNVQYQAHFIKDIKGSDLFHWGKGQVSISPTAITFMGEIAPGPDYKLYLLKDAVETGEEFIKVKQQSLQLGDIKTFDNFIVPITTDIDINQFKAVLVWCESFGQFITAAKYR